MKNNYSFQDKKMCEMSVFYIFVDLLKVWLNRRQYSHTCFCIQFLSEGDEEFSLTQTCIWKREEYLGLSNDWGYSTSCGFFKVSCIEKSETVSINFSCTLLPSNPLLCLARWKDYILVYNFVTSFQCTESKIHSC